MDSETTRSGEAGWKAPASTLKSAAQGTAELRGLRKARAAQFTSVANPSRNGGPRLHQIEIGGSSVRRGRRSWTGSSFGFCVEICGARRCGAAWLRTVNAANFYERRVSRRHDRLEYDKVGRSGVVSFVENCSARRGGAAGTCKAGADKSSATAGLGCTRPTWRL